MPQHTDHAGVMWHGAYLNWLEEARIHSLEAVGLLYRELSEEGLEMPVTSLRIVFVSALFHGDEVLLESFCLPKQGVRWPWHTKFLKCDKSLVAEAWVDLVLVRKTDSGFNILRKVPEKILIALQDLQNGP